MSDSESHSHSNIDAPRGHRGGGLTEKRRRHHPRVTDWIYLIEQVLRRHVELEADALIFGAATANRVQHVAGAANRADALNDDRRAASHARASLTVSETESV